MSAPAVRGTRSSTITVSALTSRGMQPPPSFGFRSVVSSPALSCSTSANSVYTYPANRSCRRSSWVSHLRCHERAATLRWQRCFEGMTAAQHLLVAVTVPRGTLIQSRGTVRRKWMPPGAEMSSVPGGVRRP